MAKTRILVAGSEMDTLSRIYLSLVHRNYKAEACNQPGEVQERVSRHKPAVIILDHETYLFNKAKLKIPVIVLLEKDEAHTISQDGETIVMHKPLHMDQLIQEVEKLVV